MPDQVLSVRFENEDARLIEQAIKHWAKWHNCEARTDAEKAIALMDIVEEWAEDYEGIVLTREEDRR
jgi:hypothetical protein